MLRYVLRAFGDAAHTPSSKPENGKEYPRGPRLTDLPLEIVQLIADCLQPSDAASLALCNRTLSTFLGPTYWKALSRGIAEPSQRSQFLITIARDVPQWFFCHYCSHLHPLNRIAPPGALSPIVPLHCFVKFPGILLYGYLQGHPLGSYCFFGFYHLHLALERHRHGPQYGISTDSLSLVEIQESDENEATQRLTTLLSVAARIRTNPERLCFRIQNCVVWYNEDMTLLQKRLEHLSVCFHDEGELPLLVDRWIKACADGSRLPKIEARRCERCKMDYQLEIGEFDCNGVWIVATKWLDLGGANASVQQCCDSLAENPYFPLAGHSRDLELTHSNGPGKVRSLFEAEQESLSQQQLVEQNKSYLKGQRYKEEMTKYRDGHWRLKAEDSVSPYRLVDAFHSHW